MTTLSEILSNELGLAVKAIGDNMDKEDFNASGKTKRSLLFEVSASSDYIKGVISVNDPILYAEKGRPPFTPDSGLAQRIYDWMPFRSLPQDQGLAVFISGKISKFGTKLWRDLGSKGGRREIYTDVLQNTSDNISEALRKIVSGEVRSKVNEALVSV